MPREVAGSRLPLPSGWIRQVVTMVMGKRGRNAQNLIEYTIIVALVAAAMVAMSTYVFRSVQATQRVVENEFYESR